MVTRTRRIAIEIIDVFEGVLDEHDIDIPDEDREGNEDEGRIYGSTYYLLEDTITGMLKDKVLGLVEDALDREE